MLVLQVAVGARKPQIWARISLPKCSLVLIVKALDAMNFACSSKCLRPTPFVLSLWRGLASQGPARTDVERVSDQSLKRDFDAPVSGTVTANAATVCFLLSAVHRLTAWSARIHWTGGTCGHAFSDQTGLRNCVEMTCQPRVLSLANPGVQ